MIRNLVPIGCLFILSALVPLIGSVVHELREPNDPSIAPIALRIALAVAALIVTLLISSCVAGFALKPRVLVWLPVIPFAVVAMLAYAIFFIPSSVFKFAMKHRSNRYFPAVLSAAVALALYAVTLGGTYIYDDVILHEDLRFTQPRLWSKFWTDAYMPGAIDRLYRRSRA